VDALDGNAIAGPLYEYFGHEMTSVSGRCGHCGSVARVAELRVFGRAPGSVARCPSCGHVVFVVLEIRQAAEVRFSGFELEPSAPDLSA
jgi:Family of unknown function (DUF6510)